ncbi:MAG: hypothetical protein CL811_12260 [Colwelliaceae bacterium]|nr:hypothetical protein [Colwelliaceae bacterium]
MMERRKLLLHTKAKYSQGFTLVEMVTVIILLGIVSLGVTSLLRFGTQAYVDVTARDELIASGRFAVERLNREIRAALPNSVRETSGGTCIEFVPTVGSAIYQDVPVGPEASRNTIDIIRFDQTSPAYTTPANYDVVVYPLYPDDVYVAGNNKTASLQGLNETTTNEWELVLTGSMLFADDSPTSRLFFIERDSVEFCISGSTLTRNNVLMAEDLSLASRFEVNEATHLRNAVVTALLVFERDGERVTFNNEVQVINVP